MHLEDRDTGRTLADGLELPVSPLLSAATSAAHLEQVALWQRIGSECRFSGSTLEAVSEYRRCYDRHLQSTLEKQLERHATTSVTRELAGIRVHIVRAREVADASDAILVNLHGGGFVAGSGTGALIESIPIASVTKMTVVSVDYRLYPEHTYPAASQDGVAVYRELLKQRSPSTIGIFGSSAGALLTAQVIAALNRAGDPLPGAIGMFCAGAGRFMTGDSVRISGAIERSPYPEGRLPEYFSGTDGNDECAFPGLSPAALAKFPPTLLISSVRDLCLSSVVDTHARLVAAGVPAELHVWEGLRHCFYYDPSIEESQQVYRVTADFFGRLIR